jgi:hypothetical protein
MRATYSPYGAEARGPPGRAVCRPCRHCWLAAPSDHHRPAARHRRQQIGGCGRSWRGWPRRLAARGRSSRCQPPDVENFGPPADSKSESRRRGAWHPLKLPGLFCAAKLNA